MTYHYKRDDDHYRFHIDDDSGWDGGITFSVNEDGSLSVATEQEHAVESYNQTFSNTYEIPGEIARELAEWFAEAFSIATDGAGESPGSGSNTDESK